MNDVKNENQENRIFHNASIRYVDEMVPIFP